MSLYLFKTGLVLFWAVWLAIVFLTNLFEGLKSLGILPQSWKFASQNYQMIQNTIKIYTPPHWLATVLFGGVVLWQAAAVFLMASAFIQMLLHPAGALGWVDTAFAVSIALWAAFMISDEIFCAYDNQTNHILLMIAQLAALLSIHLL